MRRHSLRGPHRQLTYYILLFITTIASGIEEHKLPDDWGVFVSTRAREKTQPWRTSVSMGEIMSTGRRSWLHRCSSGGLAVSPASSDDADDTLAPETTKTATITTTTTTTTTTTLDRLFPTRQENLASGYTYFENVYIIERQFVMIQKQGGAPLDPDSWAPIHLERQQENGVGGHAFEKRWWLGSRVWNEPSNVEEECQHTSNGTSPSNLGMVIKIPGAVVISDPLPGFVPHLYHMAENLLGLWPTYEEYAGSKTPCWLVLPHNAKRELNPAVMALAEAIFPGMLVIDEEMLRHVTKMTALDFEWVVHADRRAADHGGVNQMIHGIFNHTRRHMPSFVERAFGSLGIVGIPKQPAPYMAEDDRHPTPRVSIVDRKSLAIRRLMHTIASELYSTLAGHGSFEVRVILLEKLPLVEQVQAAAQTNVLVGVSGNGMTLSLFMSSPGAVVEIIPGMGSGLITSQKFAELAGNSYFWIDSAVGRKVHGKDGSCRPFLGEGGNGNPLDGCVIDGETVDAVVVGVNTSRIVCVVYEALFFEGAHEYSIDDICWSPCTPSRPAMGRNATCKYGGGVDYSCKDLNPYKVENPQTQSPHAMCLSGRESWGICGDGHFLCEAHAEADGILGSMADDYFREWSLVERSGLDLPRAPFARGGADLADATGRFEHHKLCVIVPFRDGCRNLSRSLEGERIGHLVTFKRYMRWFLTSVGHDDYDLIVVNQTNRGLFNRAVLINVGVDIAWMRGCDYISMHDVDMLPTNVANDYGWPELPVHQFSAYTSSNSPYGQYDFESCAAGVVTMQLRHYAQIHGMSNKYNGWGGEDNDLYERIRRVYGSVGRLDPGVGRYLVLAHGRNDETQKHPTTGKDARSENANRLEWFRNSSKFEVMEQDGFRQLREHAKLNAVLEEGEGQHVVTALVDVLEGGGLQSEC